MPGQKEGKGTMTVQEAGRKGGEKVAHSRGPEFYSEIGKKGGEAVSRDRSHMAEIGKKGGEAYHERRGQRGHDHPPDSSRHEQAEGSAKEEGDIKKKAAA